MRTLDGRATREHSTAELRQIVVPRVLETLRMAKQKIVENVPRDLVLGEVVLTGGGALLPGIEPIAEEVFALPVRIGTPKHGRWFDRGDGLAAVRDGHRTRSLRRERRS